MAGFEIEMFSEFLQACGTCRRPPLFLHLQVLSVLIIRSTMEFTVSTRRSSAGVPPAVARSVCTEGKDALRTAVARASALRFTEETAAGYRPGLTSSCCTST